MLEWVPTWIPLVGPDMPKAPCGGGTISPICCNMYAIIRGSNGIDGGSCAADGAGRPGSTDCMVGGAEDAGVEKAFGVESGMWTGAALDSMMKGSNVESFEVAVGMDTTVPGRPCSKDGMLRRAEDAGVLKALGVASGMWKGAGKDSVMKGSNAESFQVAGGTDTADGNG